MKRLFFILTLLPLTLCFYAFINTRSQERVRSSRVESSVAVLEPGRWMVWLSPKDRWFDTGINVARGTTINISATGSVVWAPPGGRNMSPRVGPNGTRPPFEEDKYRFPMPDAACGSLIMRVGATIYSVGEKRAVRVVESGTVQLMVNDDLLSDNSGGFSVKVEVLRAETNQFRRPINGGTEACVFNTTECYVKDKHHTGIDYWGENKRATDILAAGCGTVSYIQINNGKDHGMGNAIILKHSVIDETGRVITRYTLYAHMSSIESDLKVGAEVLKGQKIGFMGSSGYGKPDYWGKTPHLHFEVKMENTLANSALKESYWGYTPESAAGYGYINPEDVFRNWQSDCPESVNPQSPKTPKSSYSVRIYNIDDLATVYVNGTQVLQIPYKGTRQIDITNLLRPGQNEVRFVLENFQEGFTYGFEINRNNESIFRDECGAAGITGCRRSVETGRIYDRTVTIRVDD